MGTTSKSVLFATACTLLLLTFLTGCPRRDPGRVEPTPASPKDVKTPETEPVKTTEEKESVTPEKPISPVKKVTSAPPKESEEKKVTDPTPPPSTTNPALLDPSLAGEQAPDTFNVKMTTTKGDIVIAVTRSWSPNGADRFYNLVKIGYFTEVRFFRVVKGFMAQFGMNGDPRVNQVWGNANIQDDQVVESNQRGFVTFAKTRFPNSRSTQIFINYKNNSFLDRQGFSPIGRVSEGMDVVDSLYNGYGDGPPSGRGPDQRLLRQDGNKYLKEKFPDLDYIKSATIME